MSGHVQLRSRAAGERGAGKAKAIIVTLVLAFLVYAAFKMVPPYVDEYQLADKMLETARMASVTRNNADQIRETVYKEVQELNIPVTKDDIKVSAEGGRVSISLDYRVPIDLTLCKFDLHFTPSTANKDII